MSRFLASEMLYSEGFVLFLFLLLLLFHITSRHLSTTTGYALALHIILLDTMQGGGRIRLIILCLKPEPQLFLLAQIEQTSFLPASKYFLLVVY